MTVARIKTIIEKEPSRAKRLRQLVKSKFPEKKAHIITEDCNEALLKILPIIKYKEFKRALCLFDPYGLHLNWSVVELAGKMKTVEVFINFPLMDTNRNVLWRNPEDVSKSNIKRMNSFWGDDSWEKIAYKEQQNLFGDTEQIKIASAREGVAKIYLRRLKNIAGFEYVSEPVLMRSSKNGPLYYLFLCFTQRKRKQDSQ